MTKRSFATLGTLALLAGQYEVTVGAHNMDSLVSFDCSASQAQAITTTYPTGGGADALTEGRLVFNKYGEAYFLSQVWSPGYSQGRAINKSKTENEIARGTPSDQKKQVILAMR
jgi:hypothetical protein